MALNNLDNKLTSFSNADKPALPSDFIGSSYNNDVKTGISKFHLATMDGNTPVVLTGLLMELPEMSFTVNYEDGPGNEWQDTIANFTANGLMSIVNTLGAANQGLKWKNLIKAGTWTKKVYNGYSISNIPLKFRIYSSDPLGQTDASKWFFSLRKYAALDSEHLMSPTLLVKNAFNAVINTTNAGEVASEAMMMKYNKIQNPTKNKSAEDQAMAAAKKCEKDNDNNRRAIEIFNRAVASCIGRKFKIVWKNGNGGLAFFTNSFTGGSVDTNRTISLYYMSDTDNDKELDKQTVGHILDPKFRDSETKKTYTGNTADKPFDVADVTRAFKDLNPKAEDFDNPDDAKEWDKVKSAVLSEIERLNTGGNSESDREAFVQNIELIKELADSAGEFLIEKFNEYRVVNPFNRVNALGEKLWYLHLYEDVIFKKSNPLIVYISDWSYQMSEEYDTTLGEPVYYEFTINCVLDQVYSRDVWLDKLCEKPNF